MAAEAEPSLARVYSYIAWGGIKRIPRRRDRVAGYVAAMVAGLVTFLLVGGILIAAGFGYGPLLVALPLGIFVTGPLAAAWYLRRYGVLPSDLR